jgi:hypothetical protein
MSLCEPRGADAPVAELRRRLRVRSSMGRASVFAVLVFLAAAAPARAVLVYERPASRAIVAARDGGANPHVIARGAGPVVSPDARRVLFFKRGGNLWLVNRDGTDARRVLRHAYLDVDNPGRSWSPDSRYALAGDSTSGATFLIDVRRRTTRLYDSGHTFGFTRASFGARSRRIVLDEEDIHGPAELWLRDLHDHRLLFVADGMSPLWGPGGLAYEVGAGIWLKRHLRTPGSLLVPRPRHQYISPIDWSSDGDVLLVARGADQFERQPVFVSVPGGASKPVPGRFSLTAISGDGRLALGVLNRDVARINKRGTVHILARNASSPSWTK